MNIVDTLDALKTLWPVRAGWRAFLPARTMAPVHVGGGRPLICMLVISDVRSDPRVRREADALSKAGYEIKVLYPDCYSPSFAEEPFSWGPNISFRPVSCASGQYYATFPYVWGDEFHAAVSKERPYAFHSHDLNTALVALSAAQVAGAYCICDFHEWYSENVSWDAEKQAWSEHPSDKKEIYQALERLVLSRANGVVTVSDSIADAIRDELSSTRRRPTVIRNVPNFEFVGQSSEFDVKKEIGVSPDTFVVLWQGGIGPSRMLEPVIEAFQYLPNAVFAIRTPYWEAFGEPYEVLARELGIEDKIFRLEGVPSAKIVESASGADCGLWTLPNPCRNFYLALGNKIFEYLAAGLPILVANYPEARKVVEGHDVGLAFDPYDPKAISESIRTLQEDMQGRARMQRNAETALAALGADKEWDKLVTLYDEINQRHIA